MSGPAGLLSEFVLIDTSMSLVPAAAFGVSADAVPVATSHGLASTIALVAGTVLPGQEGTAAGSLLQPNQLFSAETGIPAGGVGGVALGAG